MVNPDPKAWDEFKTRYTRLVESRMKRYGEFDYDYEEELARYAKYREELRPFVVDTVEYMHNAIVNKKRS